MLNFRDIVFWEDEDYIIVDKPAHISTLEDRDSDVNMLSLARSAFNNVKVCHRLDKGTSGVLVFARHDEAYRQLSMQFERREVCKVYHAVVNGSVQFENYIIEKPLLTTGSGRVIIDWKKGKNAITKINTIKNFRNHSLLKCQPRTGKKHQIRIHLASIGHPITSDVLYSGREVFLSSYKKNYKLKEKAEIPLIQRVALHAFSIEFTGMNNKRIAIEIPYPKDFRVLIKQLEKYS